MPNETSNVLQMFGDQKDIDNFLKDHIEYSPEHSEDYESIFWNFAHSVPIENEEYLNAKKELEKDDYENQSKFVNITHKYENLMWGVYRGMVTYNKNNKIHMETPWSPCVNWFKNMISKYPNLNFSLKYNDEYSEDFYGWCVACKGELIDSEKICLHKSDTGGLDLFKFYNEEKGYTAEFPSDSE